MNHSLKILPCYFDAVARGDKKFEIRDNSDRGFQTGDVVILKEYDGVSKSTNPMVDRGYTGNELKVTITYVTNYEQKPNFVVFGFEFDICDLEVKG